MYFFCIKYGVPKQEVQTVADRLFITACSGVQSNLLLFITPRRRKIWMVVPPLYIRCPHKHKSLQRWLTWNVELYGIETHVRFVITSKCLCVFITQVKGDILQFYRLTIITGPPTRTAGGLD